MATASPKNNRIPVTGPNHRLPMNHPKNTKMTVSSPNKAKVRRYAPKVSLPSSDL